MDMVHIGWCVCLFTFLFFAYLFVLLSVCYEFVYV